MWITLTLEDLSPESIKYSFETNHLLYNIIVNNDLTKSIEYMLFVDTKKALEEWIIEKIYQKILWYKKIDNFFTKGFVNI